jgi:hypothetical protein
MAIKYYQGYLKFKHIFTIYVLFILHRAEIILVDAVLRPLIH